MRIFTAIPLNEAIKAKITEIIRGRLPIPYVNTTNLHITLNFFGDLVDDEVEVVKKNFSLILQNEKSFPVFFEKIIKFRNQIHLTVKPTKDLLELQSRLEKAFIAQGFQFRDRNYYPHVKLTNLHMDKVMHGERRLENFPNQELEQLSFMADKVVLFESKLLLHHVHHKALLEAKLM